MTRTSTAPVTGPANPSATEAVLSPRRKPRRPAERMKPASREAQRSAAAILEVLAGVRTPTDAAAALDVSLPRYYLWEQRALAGLVAGCEPRPVGKAASGRHQIALLQKEVARLKLDCARQQALVQAAQRTIGLAPPPVSKPAAKPGDKVSGKLSGKKPRKRRPMVRALKAAATLRAVPIPEVPPVASSAGASSGEVLQQGAVPNLSPPVTASAAGR